MLFLLFIIFCINGGNKASLMAIAPVVSGRRSRVSALWPSGVPCQRVVRAWVGLGEILAIFALFFPPSLRALTALIEISQSPLRRMDGGSSVSMEALQTFFPPWPLDGWMDGCSGCTTRRTLGARRRKREERWLARRNEWRWDSARRRRDAAPAVRSRSALCLHPRCTGQLVSSSLV
ncbi:hypothetical protein BKA81DRAFT_352361 [Phyllosticta paracitricarpa]|uniref:Uncharacterized protein n=1 Tax=Phyllosticta paracitricarpa TaxID=2016321 RepID=A0ABR1N6W2_9PEZI